MGPLAHLEQESFDVAIVTYELLAMRTSPLWSLVKDRIAGVLARASWKIALPQDDYTAFKKLDDFCCEFEFDVILTPIAQDTELLYPQCTRTGTFIGSVLTGYWETSLNSTVDKFSLPWEQRDIDLGQRVRLLPIYFGQDAQMKGRLAERLGVEAKRKGFRVDVSTRESDTLIGHDWYRFLGRSRFTVGRMGGASVGDPVGKLAYKYKQLDKRFGHLPSNQWEHRLKLSRYPRGNFSALSPRIFEAAALGVTQILEEAEYFDGFEAWKHFVPLKPDLSNSGEVLATMRDEQTAQSIASEAHRFLIQSSQFSYATFVDEVASAFPPSCHALEGSSHVIDNDVLLFGESGAWITDDDLLSLRQYAARRNVKHLKGIEGEWNAWVESIQSRALDIRLLHLPWCSAFIALSTDGT